MSEFQDFDNTLASQDERRKRMEMSVGNRLSKEFLGGTTYDCYVDTGTIEVNGNHIGNFIKTTVFSGDSRLVQEWRFDENNQLIGTKISKITQTTEGRAGKDVENIISESTSVQQNGQFVKSEDQVERQKSWKNSRLERRREEETLAEWNADMAPARKREIDEAMARFKPTGRSKTRLLMMNRPSQHGPRGGHGSAA